MEWIEYLKHIETKSKENGTPTSAIFELTPLCNFNCNMCYIHLSPEQANKQGVLLSTEQWLHLATEAKRLGVLGAEVTGGEAVTRQDFSVLYEELIRMGYLLTLRSNGYMLQGDVLKLLKKYKPRCVSITIYGASDETYQKICGISDGFSVVTRNILELREAGVNIKVSTTVTKENISDKEKLIEWAQRNDFTIYFFGGLIRPIRLAQRSIDHLKADYIFHNDINMPLPSRRILNKEAYLPPFSMCREYGTKFCITWDGRMTLCNCFPSVWSNVLTQSVGDAFKDLYLQLEKIQRPPECLDCQVIDYCVACPAQLLSETGSYEKTCEDVCRRAKARYFMS